MHASHESGLGLALKRTIIPPSAPRKPFIPVINMTYSILAVKFFWLKKKRHYSELLKRSRYRASKIWYPIETEININLSAVGTRAALLLPKCHISAVQATTFKCSSNLPRNSNISTGIWRQHNYWITASQAPIPPTAQPCQGLTGRVVGELVVFSLCGQASLSRYCTHADAATPGAPPHRCAAPFHPATQQWWNKWRFYFK